MTYTISDLKKIIVCESSTQVTFAIAIVASLRDQTDAAGQQILESISKQDLKDPDVEDLFNMVVHNNTTVLAQLDLLNRRINRMLYGMYYRDYAVNGSGHSVIISYPTGQILKGDPAGGYTNLGSLETWLHQSNCRR